jgi:hypothetical protein
MYIRRKVFSTFEDENGEERLFSTTEFMNEDEYLDEICFSDDEDQELTKSDKARLRDLKWFKTKKGREVAENAIEKNDWEPYIKHTTKRGGQVGGVIGGLYGAGMGSMAGAKGAAIGALAGTGVGAGIGALASRKLAKNQKEALRHKYTNNYRQELQDDVDLMKVADGKMSKKEYMKRNYNF